MLKYNKNKKYKPLNFLKKEIKKTTGKGFGKIMAVIGLVSFSVGVCVTELYHSLKASYVNKIPDIEHVQEGFIPPSQIEIFCEDADKSDGQGIPESYERIGKKFYERKFNEKGEPEFVPYQPKKSNPKNKKK